MRRNGEISCDEASTSHQAEQKLPLNFTNGDFPSRRGAFLIVAQKPSLLKYIITTWALLKADTHQSRSTAASPHSKICFKYLRLEQLIYVAKDHFFLKFELAADIRVHRIFYVPLKFHPKLTMFTSLFASAVVFNCWVTKTTTIKCCGYNLHHAVTSCCQLRWSSLYLV